MVSIREYIDHRYSASRICTPQSQRQIDNLHALGTLAQHLEIIRQRRAMGQRFVNGKWTPPLKGDK